MRPELKLIVPPAVNAPQAATLPLGEDADVVMNWKCSTRLGVVLALAAVMLLPATTAASVSVPAAAPTILRIIPPGK